MTTSDELAALSFHDSVIVRVDLRFDDGPLRTCTLDLDYYDWEGNAERRVEDPNAPWRTRRLRIRFGFLAAIAYATPDLIGRALVVDAVKLGDGLAKLVAHEHAQKKRYPGYASHLVGEDREPISITFRTTNWSDTEQGFLRVIGADVTLEWGASREVERTHVILFVRDQAASVRFYREVLGVEPTLDVPGMTELPLPGGAILGLMPRAGAARLLGEDAVPPEPSAGAPGELYLHVDDPAAFHARALAAGATELSAMSPRDWGDTAGYSRDPDGHVVAFAGRG